MSRTTQGFVVDVGASRVRVGAPGLSSEPLVELESLHTGAAMLNSVVAGVERVALDWGVDVGAVSLAVPGVVADGVVIRCVYAPLNGIDVAGFVGQRLGVPVSVRNDAEAQSMGLPKRGGITLYVAIGSAIGGAVVIGEGPLVSPSGCAGEIGHLPIPGSQLRCECGSVGCLDTVASGRSLEERLGGKWWLGRDQQHYQSQALSDAGSALGEVVGTCARLLGHDNTVIAGHLARYPAFCSSVEEAYGRAAWGDCSFEFVESTWPFAVEGLRKDLERLISIRRRRNSW